jgi:transglutaminase-like putative cysteine protease
LTKLAAIAVFIVSPLFAAARERSFSFEYRAVVTNVPTGAQTVEVWIPVPHDDPYQRIANLRIETNHPYRIESGELGNRILHLEIREPREGSVPVTMRFEAVRVEHRQELNGGGAEPPPDLSHWLRQDRLAPIDDTIRTWARQVVEAAHAHTDVEKARAIYDHVVSTMKYDKSGTGWGNGDIYYACDRKRGNCTDFHAVFTGFCRAVGVPARFSIGFPLPADRGAGKIAGYHCWAEFYAQGIGWIPVDASEAAKDPGKREYFFGDHDENRIEFTRGRDLVLKPPQHGEPLNYFIYPYVEVDGKKHASIETAYSYRDGGGSEAAR